MQVEYFLLIYLKEIYSSSTNISQLVPDFHPSCAELDTATQPSGCYDFLDATAKSLVVAN